MSETTERVRKVLAGFDESDSVSLPVFYRVSPQFINDVRTLLTSHDELSRAYTLATTALIQMTHEEGYV